MLNDLYCPQCGEADAAFLQMFVAVYGSDQYEYIKSTHGVHKFNRVDEVWVDVQVDEKPLMTCMTCDHEWNLDWGEVDIRN